MLGNQTVTSFTKMPCAAYLTVAKSCIFTVAAISSTFHTDYGNRKNVRSAAGYVTPGQFWISL